VPQLSAAGILHPAQKSGGLYPLAALSQERQRACRTKKLDACAPAAGLGAAGQSATGRADQPTLRTRMERVSEFFLSEYEIGEQGTGGFALSPALRPAANALPTPAPKPGSQHAQQRAVAGHLRPAQSLCLKENH